MLAGTVVGAAVALRVLLDGSGAALHVALPHMFSFAKMSLSIDSLSAFFLLVISLIAAAAAIYGPAYLGAHAKAPLVQVLALNVFVACMALVCCAGDGLTFLLAWEGMTLASDILVVCDTLPVEVALKNDRFGPNDIVLPAVGAVTQLVTIGIAAGQPPQPRRPPSASPPFSATGLSPPTGNAPPFTFARVFRQTSHRGAAERAVRNQKTPSPAGTQRK